MIVIQDKLYPLKVWLTTIVAGSIIFTLYDFFGRTGNGFGDFFGELMTLLLFNIVLSLPGLLIFFIGFGLLNHFQASIALKRWMLTLLAFSLFLLTWFGINSFFGRDAFFSAKSIFVYIEFLACIIVSSFIYGKSTTNNKALVK